MLTVSIALLMSSATVIVRSGGLLGLKPVAIVLFMLCSAVLVEWLLLKPCCVEMCGMLFVMYESSVFSSVFVLEVPDVDFIMPSGVVCFCYVLLRLGLVLW